MNGVSLITLFLNRSKSPKRLLRVMIMNWDKFLEEIEENPFLLMGVLLIALGVLSWNKIVIWTGVFMVIMIVLLTGEFDNDEKG